MQLRKVTLCLLWALFSAVSASFPEACEAQGTCDVARGSAMLQVKREESRAVSAVDQNAGVLDESYRSCISQSLQTANYKARSNHKARANKDHDEACKGLAENDACKKHGLAGKCTLPLNAADISRTSGNPQEHMFCDAGQFSACSAWMHSGMDSSWTKPADDACDLGGLKGTCNLEVSTDMASGAKLYYACKPQAEKEESSTAAPTPESGGSGGSTPAPKPEADKPEEPKPTPEPEAPKPEVPKPEALPNSLKSPAAKGAQVLAVVSNAGFFVGQDIVIDAGTAIEEHNKIVGFGSLILANPLQYDHGSGILVTAASSIGAGSTASLDAAGFKAVTSLCCPVETEVFFNRVLDQQGYDGCSKPHIQGLMHWFSCVPAMDFQYVLDVIANGNPCKYWSPKGTNCPALSPSCEGKWCR